MSCILSSQTKRSASSDVTSVHWLPESALSLIRPSSILCSLDFLASCNSPQAHAEIRIIVRNLKYATGTSNAFALWSHVKSLAWNFRRHWQLSIVGISGHLSPT